MPQRNRMWLPLAALIVSTTVTAEPDIQRQQELRHLLRHDCGSCHGMTLKGGLGPALLPESLAGKDENFLIDTVMEGRKATAMPPWKGMLTRDEVSWLIAQMRHGIEDEKK